MNAKSAGIVLLSLVLLASLSCAATDDSGKSCTEQNAWRKLGRGFANLLCGIVEVPNQISQTTAKLGGGAGCTYGVGKGFARWFGREFVGVYEIITFPIPAPHGYGPIMTPEFPTEEYVP